MYDVIEQATNDFSASQPSTTIQDRSQSKVQILSSNFEENSLLPVKTEMSESFPPLPAPSSEPPTMATAHLPHGPVLINGIYYQPVPAPHNVLVSHSTVPAPTVVPCTLETVTPAASQEHQLVAPTVTPEKPKVGLNLPCLRLPLLRSPSRFSG